MALTESASIALGTPAADFNLLGIDDRNHTLQDYKDAHVLVIIFMCNHCPYVQAIWDRLIVLAKECDIQTVQFIGINANDVVNYPEDSFENMKKYAAEKGQTFPYLHDITQTVAKTYGATCTPDIFVYDKNRLLAYHGRFDNTAGIQASGNATAEDLKEAIEALLHGQKPPDNQKPSMGCGIKWVPIVTL